MYVFFTKKFTISRKQHIHRKAVFHVLGKVHLPCNEEKHLRLKLLLLFFCWLMAMSWGMTRSCCCIMLPGLLVWTCVWYCLVAVVRKEWSYWPVNEWFFQRSVIIAFLKWSRIQAYVLMCVCCKLEFLLLASQRFPTSVFSTLAKSHFHLFSATLTNAINFVEKEIAFPKIFVNASLHCTL